MANDIQNGEMMPADHKRFYLSFMGWLKWAVVGIAALLIALAVILVR